MTFFIWDKLIVRLKPVLVLLGSLGIVALSDINSLGIPDEYKLWVKVAAILLVSLNNAAVSTVKERDSWVNLRR
jgi:hypothetical protein